VVQPTNQLVAAGSAVFLIATVAGTTPLSYRWRANGVVLTNGGRISGATSNVLVLSPVQISDTGSYALVVSNSVGRATSAPPTRLTVLLPPALTLSPTNKTISPGTSVKFNSAATGSEPLSYQWLYHGQALANGGQIVGANTNTLVITSAQPSNAGLYAVRVSNPVGTVTSTGAFLNVLGPPWIVVQPASQAVPLGSNAVFSVLASGTTPLSYRWRFNGTNLTDGGSLSGSATSQLMVSNVHPARAGNYTVVVTNAAGSTASQAARLTLMGNCRLSLALTTDGHARLTLTGAVASVWRVESTPQLGLGSWTTLTNLTLTGGSASFTDPQPMGVGRRFYRAVQP
jgi:hypothetical protein